MDAQRRADGLGRDLSAPAPRATLTPPGPWRIAAFFALTFAISWGLTVIAAPTSPERAAMLMVLGPIIAAIALVSIGTRPEQRKDFWARAFDLTRIRARWMLAACALPIAIGVAAVTIGSVLSERAVTLETPVWLSSRPWLLLPFALSALVLGPVPEELGWRGYALDGLQARLGALGASVVLGALWGVWHGPLCFVEGSWHHALGIGSLAFWSFIASAVLYSILITWIYNHTGRSTLVAVVFHWMINLTRGLLPGSAQSVPYEVGVLVIVVLIVLRFGGNGLPWSGNSSLPRQGMSSDGHARYPTD